MRFDFMDVDGNPDDEERVITLKETPGLLERLVGLKKRVVQYCGNFNGWYELSSRAKPAPEVESVISYFYGEVRRQEKLTEE